jgi:hypothetical protein
MVENISSQTKIIVTITTVIVLIMAAGRIQGFPDQTTLP